MTIWHRQGGLNGAAARILIKALWLGRLARPKLCFIIGRLAARVSRRSRWEDRQLLRMVSYLHWTTDFCMSASLVHEEVPQLHIYTDSDFGSCPHTAKSTSGIVMSVVTGKHKFPVWWSSKRQSTLTSLLSSTGLKVGFWDGSGLVRVPCSLLMVESFGFCLRVLSWRLRFLIRLLLSVFDCLRV